ncbi:meckelin (Transmembrane protein 67) domain-containing protein [Phthorimaea operculella]|nr:meckelin (Transmembrane protein 67) domain-containing protein [Phthorimaea operculella]
MNCDFCFRTIYKQLAAPGRGGLNEKDSKKALLSKFLATFFERALDGLSWVANERTVLERLLDVELMTRESGSTSILLYDAESASSPSCFSVTWWGEEWTHGTFDAALFGCVFVATDDTLLATLATVVAWQVLKFLRMWCGNKNQTEKTDIEIPLYCS